MTIKWLIVMLFLSAPWNVMFLEKTFALPASLLSLLVDGNNVPPYPQKERDQSCWCIFKFISKSKLLLYICVSFNLFNVLSYMCSLCLSDLWPSTKCFWLCIQSWLHRCYNCSICLKFYCRFASGIQNLISSAP